MTPRRPVVRINRPLGAAGTDMRRRRRLRVGLLGGSFNPAHEGHRAISIEALRRLRLDQVWWLVSPQNPLKTTRGMAGFAERHASARALADHPRIVVSDLEQRLGTRYSVDTLRRLQRGCRERFIWLMGADILAELPRWHRWREFVGRAPIAVFDREPQAYRALAGQAAQAYAGGRRRERDAGRLAEATAPAWVFLHLRRRGVSSTEIRQERTEDRPGAGQ